MTWLRNPSLDPATRRCLLKRKWRKANWEAKKGLNDDIFIEEEEEEIFLFITCSNCGMSYRHISGRRLINYSIHRQKGRTGGAAITQRHYLWCLDSSRRFLSLCRSPIISQPAQQPVNQPELRPLRREPRWTCRCCLSSQNRKPRWRRRRRRYKIAAVAPVPSTEHKSQDE